jgi:predicted ribonuclease YlaK
MKDQSKTVKLLTGTWGTGKTLILVSAALEALKAGRFKRIVWIRNNVDVKDTKDLGALPGEVIDKLLPFLGPFIDHAGENSVRTMLNKGTLVVEPLQSLRGRNFDDTLIMCSEAENLTKEHIQLIIARAAEGSEVWFDADNRQRDKASFEKSKGIETLIERFAGQKLFGYVHLVKSERSATAAMADLLN